MHLINFDISKYIKYENKYETFPNLIVCSMFTKGYTKINRLIRSCDKHNISYVFCEVPYLHNSKSIACSQKFEFLFTLPNFINQVKNYVINKYPSVKICLCIDADMYFRNPPDNIILESKDDIMMYNWIGDTDCNRPYKYDGEKNWIGSKNYPQHYDPRYAQTSGGTVGINIYSKYAHNVLTSWHSHIYIYSCFVNYNTPTVCAEDQILDIVWNNRQIEDFEKIKPLWLPKSYLRLPWWPWIKPIIKHPDKIGNNVGRPNVDFTIPNYKKFMRFPPSIKTNTALTTFPDVIHRSICAFWETDHPEDVL